MFPWALCAYGIIEDIAQWIENGMILWSLFSSSDH